MRRVPVVVLLSLLAALLTTAPAAAVGEVSDTINIRLPQGANDPLRLALRLSRATFADGGADEVLLATVDTFADALSSGTLQGSDTPLLLTPSDDVRADVGEEIERLGASRVTLLGGTRALTPAVQEELEEADLDVRRISGSNRVLTAVAVSETVPEATSALLSRAGAGEDASQGFADALAAGAWAAAEGWPSLLTDADRLPEATRERLADSAVETVYVLGGTAAISDAVIAELVELGLDVVRVAGPNRAATAVQVAAARGFATAADAARIVLVEGQAPDAWAAGFAAAAYSARELAPVLLASGSTLPPETRAFLEANRFAVDVDEVVEPVLVCAAEAVACDEARVALGLPREATVVTDEPAGGVPTRSQLTGVVELFGADADVAAFGACTEGGTVPLAEDGRFALDIVGPPGACSLEFEIRFANGTVQQLFVPVIVADALPITGVVIDTETGGDAYTFVPEGADAPLTVSYREDDRFVVNGEPATIGAFEAAITVADTLTYQPETVDGDVHQLFDVSPTAIRSGTVGDVDLRAGTFAIIEPVSGTALRPGVRIDGAVTYAVDGSSVERAVFEGDINEGDTVSLEGDGLALRNVEVSGPVNRIQADRVSGILRFGIRAFGDDPLNEEDDSFRLVKGSETQRYRVDGAPASFDTFADALTVGDQAAYRRTGGVEVFSLTNGPTPAVVGRVTERFDPDGSPIAPEPEDGGSIVLLTAEGRREISYTAGATFRVDGRLATEAELEAVRTPGDEVVYQPADPATSTPEQLTLVNDDLVGDLADITEGANTLDVVTAFGVLYDDLDYTAAIFGGQAEYYDGPQQVGLDDFERLLGAIDAGEQQATLLVRAGGQGTQHRLTFTFS